MSQPDKFSGLPRVVLTRPDNADVAKLIKDAGGVPIEIPLIEIRYEAVAEDSDEFFDHIATYDWLTFSSKNGVKGFFKEFFRKYQDIRCIGPCRIACTGYATARFLLENYRLISDVVPESQTVKDLPKCMMAHESLDNRNILCVGGSLSDKSFMKELEDVGGAMTEFFEVYKTSLVNLSETGKSVQDFKKSGADYVVFSSPSAVESFLKNAKTLQTEKGALAPKAVSIGKTTSAAVKKFGLPLVSEADEPSPEGILRALLSADKKQK